MHKSTFDEDQLQELLQGMPKVRDSQDPEELFAKISSRLEEDGDKKRSEERKIRTRKKRAWIVPTFASAAAVVIIALVLPTIMHQQQKSTMENRGDEPKKEVGVNNIQEKAANDEKNFTMMAKESQNARIATFTESHLITDITDEQQVITVALPDQNAQFIVPISFIVPKDNAQSNLNRLATIKQYLHEDEWGLSNYILDGVLFSEEALASGSKKLIVDVPANHSFGVGSTMEVMFLDTVKEMAKQMGYNVVQFRTEGKQGITLGNYGEINEIKLQEDTQKSAYYVFQPYEQAQKYLVPFTTKFEFSKALEALKSSPDLNIQQIKPSIPEEIEFQHVSVDDQNKIAIIEFAKGTNLKNEETDILMIEAILMTAKEYGVQFVEFKNALPEFLGPYNLSQPIKVPLGVNPKPY